MSIYIGSAPDIGVYEGTEVPPEVLHEFYVDQTLGVDANAGSFIAPWKTLAKVMSYGASPGFIAGDKIYLKCGETWRETLTVPSAGASGQPITITSYGTGAAPIINGSNLITGWIQNDIYLHHVTLATAPYQVFYDGTAYTQVLTQAACGITCWYYDVATTTLFIGAIDPNTHTVEASYRDRCIYVNGKNYINIINIKCGKNNGLSYGAIDVNASTYVKVQGCTIEYGIGRGIWYHNSSHYAEAINNTITIGNIHVNHGNIFAFVSGIWGDALSGCSSITVSGNIISCSSTTTSSNGICSRNGVGITINGNTITSIAEHSILIDTCTNGEIYNNIIHDVGNDLEATTGIDLGIAINFNLYNNTIYNVTRNAAAVDGVGLFIDVGSKNCKAYFNRIYQCDGTGIHFYQCDTSLAYYNVIYDCGNNPGQENQYTGIAVGQSSYISLYNNTISPETKYGIKLIGSASNTHHVTIKNNIVNLSTSYCIHIDADSIGNLTSDYNDFYFTAGSCGYYNITACATLAAWRTASGQDAHSLSVIPNFENLAGDNFRLANPNPCVDTGTIISGLVVDIEGNAVPRHGGTDMGAYESDYTGQPVGGGTQYTIYYVNATDGIDTNTGGTPEQAWKTLAKVNASTFNPGDQVLLKRGETWHESLTVPSSGTLAGGVITFGAYSVGDNPIISGGDVITGWALTGGTTYSVAMATEPRVVFYNGTRLTQNSQLPTAQNVDLLNETFEGTGYSASGWSENGSPNEDADIALVGSPADWGSQCLQIVAGDNEDTNTVWTSALTRAISYTRLDFILSTNTISEYLDVNRVAQGWTDVYGTPWRIWVQRALLGELKFLMGAVYDGSFHYYTSFCPCYPGRKYRIEVKWDFTNKLWAWKINGVAQPNNVDSTDPVTSDGTMTGGGSPHVKKISIGPQAGGSNYKSCTMYFDNVGMSAVTWVGQPLGDLGLNEWHWESNVLYVNVGENPSTGVLEAGQRNYPLTVSNKSYITVNNIDLTMANHSAVYVNNSSYLTLDGGEWRGGGFYGEYTPGAPLCSYVTFTNLDIHGFGSSGINISADADYWDHVTISHCKIYDNGWQFIHSATTTIEGNSAGIKAWGGKYILTAGESDYVTIEYNEVYNNYDQWGGLCGNGIWVDQWGDGAIVRYNNVHDNDAGGIVLENMDNGQCYHNIVYSNMNGIFVYRNATGQTVYNNVIYDNERGGIRCGGGSGETAMTGNIFKNNIVLGNGRALSAYYGGDNVGGGSGNVYTYNCFGPEATNFIEWGIGVYKNTYDSWEAAYGVASHSVKSDPQFVSTSLPDFHLVLGSPCINAGTSVGLTRDYEGNVIGLYPDIGVYETGAYKTLGHGLHISMGMSMD